MLAKKVLDSTQYPFKTLRPILRDKMLNELQGYFPKHISKYFLRI